MSVEEFLENVPIFSTLTKYHRSICADALAELKVEDGQNVVTQNENGDAFYIVVDGEFVCMQTAPGDTEAAQLTVLVRGDYFGCVLFFLAKLRWLQFDPCVPRSEIALIRNCPRVATVSAKGVATCVRIPAATFSKGKNCPLRLTLPEIRARCLIPEGGVTYAHFPRSSNIL